MKDYVKLTNMCKKAIQMMAELLLNLEEDCPRRGEIEKLKKKLCDDLLYYEAHIKH